MRLVQNRSSGPERCIDSLFISPVTQQPSVTSHRNPSEGEAAPELPFSIIVFLSPAPPSSLAAPNPAAREITITFLVIGSRRRNSRIFLSDRGSQFLREFSGRFCDDVWYSYCTLESGFFLFLRRYCGGNCYGDPFRISARALSNCSSYSGWAMGMVIRDGGAGESSVGVFVTWVVGTL